MKIGYKRLDGGTSTAYLNRGLTKNGTWTCDHGDAPHTGFDKYTDDPVTVHWDDAEDQWIETDSARCPQVIRGTTLRITPINTDGRPAGTATVTTGFYQLSVGGTDPDTVELDAAPKAGAQHPLIATGTRIRVELWAPLDLWSWQEPLWHHYTLDAVEALQLTGRDDGSIAYTGRTAPGTGWSITATPKTATPRTRTQTKRLTRAQRKRRR